MTDVLYAYMQHATGPAHFLFEEADNLVPNRVGRNAISRWARLARNKGFGWTFSTQRHQLLSPEVVESSLAIIAMKITGERGSNAIELEIESRAGRTLARAIGADLPKMRRGDAWLVPDSDWMYDVGVEDAEPDLLHMRKRHSFDPRPLRIGEEAREPGPRAAIDLIPIEQGLRDIISRRRARAAVAIDLDAPIDDATSENEAGSTPPLGSGTMRDRTLRLLLGRHQQGATPKALLAALAGCSPASQRARNAHGAAGRNVTGRSAMNSRASALNITRA